VILYGPFLKTCQRDLLDTGLYLDLIRRGFKDKTYGMPLFALAFNLSWEFLYSFVFRPTDDTLQHFINLLWFLFDDLILVTYLKFGKKEFPSNIDQRWFYPWTILTFITSGFVMYTMALEFEGGWGAIYAAFAQNLMMSILFIHMLVQRSDVRGQSMYIAIFKGIGTLAPTILFFHRTQSLLVLTLGLGCAVYDLIYIIMLFYKFRELTLNPFTRKRNVSDV